MPNQLPRCARDDSTLGTGHPLMRFAPPGHASLKEFPRSPHPTPFAQPTATSGWQLS